MTEEYSDRKCFNINLLRTLQGVQDPGMQPEPHAKEHLVKSLPHIRSPTLLRMIRYLYLLYLTA